MISNQDAERKQFKYFSFLSMFYCTLLIASVLLPYKIISLFGFIVPGGIFIFPLTYLLGGAIAEAYGRNMAIKMVYSSIFCLLAFNVIIALIVRIPSAPNVPNQEIFMQAFGNSIRLSLGCLAGLICSDLTNVYRITKLKLIFGGKYFVQRLLWSTALSEILFNIVTYAITYAGIIPISHIIKIIFSSWLLKMIYSLFMIFPLLLLMNFLKKAEGIDVYDVTNDQMSTYNPENLFIKLIGASTPPNKESVST